MRIGKARQGQTARAQSVVRTSVSTDNLYVSDGSFMPTAGSVPPTFTIYANAFRVAERIKQRL